MIIINEAKIAPVEGTTVTTISNLNFEGQKLPKGTKGVVKKIEIGFGSNKDFYQIDFGKGLGVFEFQAKDLWYLAYEPPKPRFDLNSRLSDFPKLDFWDLVIIGSIVLQNSMTAKAFKSIFNLDLKASIIAKTIKKNPKLSSQYLRDIKLPDVIALLSPKDKRDLDQIIKLVTIE